MMSLSIRAAVEGVTAPPLERDPRFVQKDMDEGELTIGYARENYGVVVDPKSLTIDEAQTEKLRTGMRAARLREGSR